MKHLYDNMRVVDITFLPQKSSKIKSNTIRNSKIEHEKEYYSFCDL